MIGGTGPRASRALRPPTRRSSIVFQRCRSVTLVVRGITATSGPASRRRARRRARAGMRQRTGSGVNAARGASAGTHSVRHGIVERAAPMPANAPHHAHHTQSHRNPRHGHVEGAGPAQGRPIARRAEYRGRHRSRNSGPIRSANRSDTARAGPRRPRFRRIGARLRAHDRGNRERGRVEFGWPESSPPAARAGAKAELDKKS